MEHYIQAIDILVVKNYLLLSCCLDLGRIKEAKQLQYIDKELLLLRYKMLGLGKRYIWRTRDDEKVRPLHAVNDNKIFYWDKKPFTGHPGETYNCRCWAEPIGDNKYARQFLTTPINDNPYKWTNTNFTKRYLSNVGGSVTLQEVGLLGSVIEHYSKKLGIYDRASRQIIDKAKTIEEGSFTYSFENSYKFGNNWDFIRRNGFFSLGSSTVKGVFDGGVRREKRYLVINGVITYNFSDKFTDPTSKVERLMEREGITREEAIARLGDLADEYGTPYDIIGSWQTKFNATVRLIE